MVSLPQLTSHSTVASAACIASRVITYIKVSRGEFLSPVSPRPDAAEITAEATQHLGKGVDSILVYIWLCCMTALDLITTGTIATCLIRSRTGWATTDRMIGRLLLWVSPLIDY